MIVGPLADAILGTVPGIAWALQQPGPSPIGTDDCHVFVSGMDHVIERHITRPGVRSRTLEGPSRAETVACARIERLATEYLESSLSGEEARLFEAHLDACRSCRDFLSQTRLVSRIARQLREEGVPPATLARLTRAFAAWADGRIPDSNEPA
jgi:hypothetical protein